MLAVFPIEALTQCRAYGAEIVVSQVFLEWESTNNGNGQRGRTNPRNHFHELICMYPQAIKGTGLRKSRMCLGSKVTRMTSRMYLVNKTGSSNRMTRTKQHLPLRILSLQTDIVEIVVPAQLRCFDHGI